MAPAARAIVTKYREESQSKLVEWLKDGGLLDGASEDLEKVKQQIKRRKMTLKRKQKRDGEPSSQATSSQDGSSQDSSFQDSTAQDTSSQDGSSLRIASASHEVEDDDPLWSAKINILQDDSFISLIDPPQDPHLGTPSNDEGYNSDEGEASLREEAAHYAASESNPFGFNGPYSPTTVVDEVSPVFGFHSVFESAPLLHATDLFPRITPEFPMSHMPSLKRERPFTSNPAPSAGLDPSGTYHQAAV